MGYHGGLGLPLVTSNTTHETCHNTATKHSTHDASTLCMQGGRMRRSQESWGLLTRVAHQHCACGGAEYPASKSLGASPSGARINIVHAGGRTTRGQALAAQDHEAHTPKTGTRTTAECAHAERATVQVMALARPRTADRRTLGENPTLSTAGTSRCLVCPGRVELPGTKVAQYP